METIFSGSGITVYDDFAHHPTAIASTLGGLREHVGEAMIVAVIEPASHTMKNGTHAATLGAATSKADLTFWFQPPHLNWEMGALSNQSSRVSDDHDTLVEQILAVIQSSSRPIHIVIMSNGAFAGLHQKLGNALQNP